MLRFPLKYLSYEEKIYLFCQQEISSSMFFDDMKRRSKRETLKRWTWKVPALRSSQEELKHQTTKSTIHPFPFIVSHSSFILPSLLYYCSPLFFFFLVPFCYNRLIKKELTTKSSSHTNFLFPFFLNRSSLLFPFILDLNN